MPTPVYPTKANPDPNYEAHMARTIAELEQEVRHKNLPEPAIAGGLVLGIPDAGVKLKDPRPQGNLTGTYSPQIIQEVVQAAKRHNIDPALALAMSLQETTLGSGSRGANNPMFENNVEGYSHGPEFGNAWTLEQAEDWQNDSPQHAYATQLLTREGALNAAMTHFAQLQKQHANSPEAHQIQAYNGLGKPKRYDAAPMYGMPINQLPQDFYGKRVQDIRDNFVNQSPYLQQLIKGIN